ncbi:hypothetical protein ANCDUO_16603, partial [Ancylostoma duodenale]
MAERWKITMCEAPLLAHNHCFGNLLTIRMKSIHSFLRTISWLIAKPKPGPGSETMSLQFVGVCFFLGATLVSVPVYFAVLYIIATHRRLRIFRSSFYALTLSNGVFDLTSAILFVVLECFPHLSFASEMFWNNRSTYLPTFSLGLTFMLLFIRIFGIASLVLERAAEAFYGEAVLEQLLNRPMCCLSTIFRWMVSLVLAWPVFIQMDISYSKVDGETMTFIPDHDIQ